MSLHNGVRLRYMLRVYERSLSRHATYQPLALQRSHCLADGHPSHAQLLHHVALGREHLARLQAAGEHLVDQMVSEPLVLGLPQPLSREDRVLAVLRSSPETFPDNAVAVTGPITELLQPHTENARVSCAASSGPDR